jgi:hypothetical protein
VGLKPSYKSLPKQRQRTQVQRLGTATEEALKDTLYLTDDDGGDNDDDDMDDADNEVDSGRLNKRERALFIVALTSFGYGRWSDIRDFVVAQLKLDAAKVTSNKIAAEDKKSQDKTAADGGTAEGAEAELEESTTKADSMVGKAVIVALEDPVVVVDMGADGPQLSEESLRAYGAGFVKQVLLLTGVLLPQDKKKEEAAVMGDEAPADGTKKRGRPKPKEGGNAGDKGLEASLGAAIAASSLVVADMIALGSPSAPSSSSSSSIPAPVAMDEAQDAIIGAVATEEDNKAVDLLARLPTVPHDTWLGSEAFFCAVKAHGRAWLGALDRMAILSQGIAIDKETHISEIAVDLAVPKATSKPAAWWLDAHDHQLLLGVHRLGCHDTALLVGLRDDEVCGFRSLLGTTVTVVVEAPEVKEPKVRKSKDKKVKESKSSQEVEEGAMLVVEKVAAATEEASDEKKEVGNEADLAAVPKPALPVIEPKTMMVLVEWPSASLLTRRFRSLVTCIRKALVKESKMEVARQRKAGQEEAKQAKKRSLFQAAEQQKGKKQADKKELQEKLRVKEDIERKERLAKKAESLTMSLSYTTATLELDAAGLSVEVAQQEAKLDRFDADLVVLAAETKVSKHEALLSKLEKDYRLIKWFLDGQLASMAKYNKRCAEGGASPTPEAASAASPALPDVEEMSNEEVEKKDKKEDATPEVKEVQNKEDLQEIPAEVFEKVRTLSDRAQTQEQAATKLKKKVVQQQKEAKVKREENKKRKAEKDKESASKKAKTSAGPTSADTSSKASTKVNTITDVPIATPTTTIAATAITSLPAAKSELVLSSPSSPSPSPSSSSSSSPSSSSSSSSTPSPSPSLSSSTSSTSSSKPDYREAVAVLVASSTSTPPASKMLTREFLTGGAKAGEGNAKETGNVDSVGVKPKADAATVKVGSAKKAKTPRTESKTSVGAKGLKQQKLSFFKA